MISDKNLDTSVRTPVRGVRSAPIYRAAVAVLVVGATGYVGGRVMTGRAQPVMAGSNIQPVDAPALLSRAAGFGGGSGGGTADLFSDRGRQVKQNGGLESVSADSSALPAAPGSAPTVMAGDRLGTFVPAFEKSSNTVSSSEKITGSVAGLNYFHVDKPGPGKRAGGFVSKYGVAPEQTITADFDGVAAQPVQGKLVDGTSMALRANAAEDNAATPAETPAAAMKEAPALVPMPVPASVPASAQASAQAPTTQPADDRKIIRTGSMEFEVDRFDTAQTQIIKIVTELGGFVGATDSQKLPNGKVRGSITVRVAPERLDTLVMSLRALGELKNQQISAMDVTKEYTDLQSELIADRAMQDRLLDLIHTGKGSVKDLLAAENELGTWRGKIEKAEGAIRYYNTQVALSTLTITLSERDIQTPATAIETETADVGIEAQDVEKARNSAISLIENAKGRILEAELKHYDAGQLAGRLVADVPPESAGAILDQLKLSGKVARLEIHRQQATGEEAAPMNLPIKTDRKPTRLLIWIYNLANIAPRHSTHVSVAAKEVETAYAALCGFAKSNGGRVVTSNLDRGDPAKATGTLVLEIPPDKFELAMSAIGERGEVLNLTLVENPDVQNSTEAKQGLTVSLVSLASVRARESVEQSIATDDVSVGYQAVLTAAAATHSRVQSAQLNQQDRQNITADLQLDVPRVEMENFEKALASVGGTFAQNSTRAAQVEGTVDSKLAVRLSITSADHLPPRETTHLKIETADVEKSATDIQAAAITAGGRVLESSATSDHGRGTARVSLDLPLNKTSDMLRQLRTIGPVSSIDSSRDPQAPTGAMAHGQILVEFDTSQSLVADQTGPWASIRQGLATSITGLMWSLQWVVVGLCLIGPWALIAWGGLKLWRRRNAV